MRDKQRHNETTRKSNKKRKTELKAQGLCLDCKKVPSLPGQFKCQTCREERNRQNAIQVRRRKRLVVDHYGGNTCACCNETKSIKFLHIDHINGGGNTHRREIGGKSGANFYCWLIKNNYPEGFQVLCADCNMAKGMYGECPHVKQRRDMLLNIANLDLIY